MNNCSHTIAITGHWTTVHSAYEEDDSVEWVHEHEESTFEDIDLHRYRCTLCGEIGYYSNAARQYYENGIKCNIRGLDK